MIIILGDDANVVDHEVYRIRNCGQPVYGACSVRALRALLLQYGSNGATIRAVPARYETDPTTEIVLHKLGEKAIDECFARMGS